jgi:hypothetical protein
MTVSLADLPYLPDVRAISYAAWPEAVPTPRHQDAEIDSGGVPERAVDPHTTAGALPRGVPAFTDSRQTNETR